MWIPARTNVCDGTTRERRNLARSELSAPVPAMRLTHARNNDMRILMRGLSIAAVLSLPCAAPAFNNGQYDEVPDNVRSWFKSVRSPHGVPCCDIADGHRTTWDKHPGDERYWVTI